VPELPEVEALAAFLRERAVGRVVARVDVVSIAVLKTYDPPASSLGGLEVTSVARHGKFLDLVAGEGSPGDGTGLHLVTHLARAGWLQWREELPTAPPRMGKGPIGLRLHLDDGSGFDLTEAGTKKGLAVYLVRDLHTVPGVARLGIDPLSPEFTEELLAGLLTGVRGQVKGVLTDQSLIAGLGNAYSDEVLWEVGLSPFKPAGNLTPTTCSGCTPPSSTPCAEPWVGQPAWPPASSRPRRRAGWPCTPAPGCPAPRAATPVREVSFADKSLQYCPTCQTDGKPLADRRLSRLLK
jgi:formamidopyrimidine-DNA glycosylase